MSKEILSARSFKDSILYQIYRKSVSIKEKKIIYKGI
jgi:hypothetical protein